MELEASNPFLDDVVHHLFHTWQFLAYHIKLIYIKNVMHTELHFVSRILYFPSRNNGVELLKYALRMK